MFMLTVAKNVVLGIKDAFVSIVSFIKSFVSSAILSLIGAVSLAVLDKSQMEHAFREIKKAGLDADMAGVVLKLLGVFMADNHVKKNNDIHTHEKILSVFSALAMKKNATPLTDSKDEWIEIGEYIGKKIWQNTRNSSCFSFDNGKTYFDINSVKSSGFVDSAKTNNAKIRAIKKLSKKTESSE